MKRILSAALAVIILLGALVSCKPFNPFPLATTDSASVTTTAPIEEGTLLPSGERRAFEECGFYELLGYIDTVYKQYYIYEYDSDTVYANTKKVYDEGYFDELVGEDLIHAVTNYFIYEIGDLYGAYFTENGYADFVADMEGVHVGIGISVVYLENFGYHSVKGDKSSETVYGGIMVVHIENGSKVADKVKVGDVIIRIEGENVSDLGFDESAEKIRGDVGTMANFTILRGAEIIEGDNDPYPYAFDSSDAVEMDVSAERVDFVAGTVDHEMMDGNIGYIRILQFYNNTEYEFLEAFVELIDGGAKKFIFDVRGNPGGSVDRVLPILSIILDYDKNSDMKAIFTVADKNGEEDPEYLAWSEEMMDYYDIDKDDKATEELPYANIADEYAYFASELKAEAELLEGEEKEEALELAAKYERYATFDYQLPEGAEVVVLADGNSASGAEHFTKILSDFGISYIIGEKTFGKGSMQTMMPARGYTVKYGVVKVTANTYSSPYSDNFNGIGIYPDLEVTLETVEGYISPFLIPREKDNQLSAAIEYLTK